jgi:replication factor C small subunit
MSKYLGGLPWIEKYRPVNLDDIIGLDKIIKILSIYIARDELPNLLFFGPPGTGKTTLVYAIMRKLYGEDFRDYFLDLNASDDRGIDVVRDQIDAFTHVSKRKKKYIFLDEADSMTIPAQSALKRVIDGATTTRFFIVCNNISEIIDGIQSRTLMFGFNQIDKERMLVKLREISIAESMVISDEAIMTIIKNSRDFRHTIGNLQCVKMLSETGKVTIDTVADFLNVPTKEFIGDLYTKMHTNKFEARLDCLQNIYYANKFNFKDVLTAYIQHAALLGNGIEIPALSEMVYQLHKGVNQLVILSHWASL